MGDIKSLEELNQALRNLDRQLDEYIDSGAPIEKDMHEHREFIREKMSKVLDKYGNEHLIVLEELYERLTGVPLYPESPPDQEEVGNSYADASRGF